jgi:uncharacterized protein DUF2630
MDDHDILGRVSSLVDEEHQLRSGPMDDDARRRLTAIQVQLDQCWDLLRQREGRRDAGEDPDQAHVRPPGEVEGYLQ